MHVPLNLLPNGSMLTRSGDRPGSFRADLVDDRAGGEGCPLTRELVEANSSTRLRLGPAIRDLYRAAADAGLSDDNIALVARRYR